MAKRLHQIGAAIPLSVTVSVRFVAHAFNESRIPEKQAQADIERERQLRFRRLLVDRRHFIHEIGVKSTNVVIRSIGERRIGHRRVQAPAVPGNAISNGAAKISQCVTANTIDWVRRNVRRVNDSERRIDRQSACKRQGLRSGRVAGSIQSPTLAR